MQRLCLRVPQHAFCFSRLHEARLVELGVNGPVTRLEGEYDGPPAVDDAARPSRWSCSPAGISPRSACLPIPPAIRQPARRGPIFAVRSTATGPSARALLRLVSELGLEEVIDAPGFVEAERIEAALARALCLLLPSRREGYGLVVLEAAARGTPSIVVRGPDNAATELVEEGVNGFVAPSASPEDLARAIAAVAAAASLH